ncbi:MAG: hypothetical protein GVY22_06770 [Gammaproteobacteria bacterium]|jgi:hypothetical protein|nr:hypothetical protein [Gammaproteobacteria bacterium]
MPALVLLLIALASPLTGASASSEPSVFIPDSSAARVKALALDTALLKGWTLVESSPNLILFETRLEQPASAGPPGAALPQSTLMRIRTRLEQTPTGTRVSAGAEEHWWPGTAQAWSTDITQRYRDNLQRALRSLQQRWEQFTSVAATSSNHGAPVQPGSSPRPPSTQPLPIEPSLEPNLDTAPVGLWAYDAERYAQARGCKLHDRGAVLAQARQRDELHRVYCVNRQPVMVSCDNVGCGP